MKKLDLSNIGETIQRENEHLVLYFKSDTCGPCRAITPAMEKASESMGVYEVNITSSPALGPMFNVRQVPYLVVMKDGKIVLSRGNLNLSNVTDILEEIKELGE